LAIIAAVFTWSKFATVTQKGHHVVDTIDNQSQADERIADDTLKGAIAIGLELGLRPYQVNYLFKTGKLPIGKMGKQYVASRRKLRRAMQKYTA
jgi:hypothetical protein